MGDSTSSESQRDPDRPLGPYTVAPFDQGCPHCGRGKRYTIVGPGMNDEGWDEIAAQDEVKRLNATYEAGRRSVTSSGKP